MCPGIEDLAKNVRFYQAPFLLKPSVFTVAFWQRLVKRRLRKGDVCIFNSPFDQTWPNREYGEVVGGLLPRAVQSGFQKRERGNSAPTGGRASCHGTDTKDGHREVRDLQDALSRPAKRSLRTCATSPEGAGPSVFGKTNLERR